MLLLLKMGYFLLRKICYRLFFKDNIVTDYFLSRKTGYRLFKKYRSFKIIVNDYFLKNNSYFL